MVSATVMKANRTTGKRNMATKPIPPKSEITTLEQLAERMSESLERRLAKAPKAERERVTRSLERLAKEARESSGKQ